jgi:hypothetical protein
MGSGCRLVSAADVAGLYARVQGTFARAVERQRDAGAGGQLASMQSLDLSLSGDGILATGAYTHSGVIAGRLGIYNVMLTTVQESFRHDGTPSDTTANVDIEAMNRQLSDLVPVLHDAASDDGLSAGRSIRPDGEYFYPTFTNNRVEGALAMSAAGGSAMPNRRTANVLAAVHVNALPAGRRTVIRNFNNFFIAFSDTSGVLQYGPLLKGWRNIYHGFASTFNERGEVDLFVSEEKSASMTVRVNLYPVRHGAVVLPASLDAALRPQVVDGPSNGALQPKKSFTSTDDRISTWFVEKKTRTVKLFGRGQSATLAVFGDAPEKAADAPEDANDMPGSGGGVAADAVLTESLSRRTAKDVWQLNEARLAVLRARGIMNGSLEELHGRAEDLMLAADGAEDTAGREALLATAAAIQHQTYKPVRGMLDDLVQAVLILLALCVPFAFALERLLINSTRIYRQRGWFIGFVTATFRLLYISHPAFAISRTPSIIFLGFTIVVLSGLVIVIIMQKFETELRVLQGMESSLHAADVSRLSTVVAAMSMGISSMRRRPLRTALTAVTIILLTFTILGFASFSAKRGILRFFVQPSPEYSSVFVRDLMWRDLSEEMTDVMRHHWGRETPMVVRRWASPQQRAAVYAPVTAPDGENVVTASAILGIDEAELLYRPRIAALLQSPAAYEETVWMTEAAADRANVKAGDKALVAGLLFTVGRPMNAVELQALKDIDESSILPVDFGQASAVNEEEDADLSEMAEAAADISWQSVLPDAVVVMSADNAARLGARPRAVVFYPATTHAAEVLGEDIARALPVPVSATRSDGVYRHVLGASLAASGLKSLFFPILLGGMVIFGTMLGSVADREKEIFTFSALGLAPPHVAGLFFSEALIYSVTGGMGGYLLAQGSLKLLEVLANMGLVHVPEMNYSSMNAIITILIVMATVMVSAIYPAIKASRSANPGVMRSWRIPAPDGDVLDMTFPFTVSQYDITGVVSFLREHFESFSDVGMGVFMAMETDLKLSDGDALKLEAKLALAPFDLGVTQDLVLTSRASEIDGIDEVAITITRLSGQPRDWTRQNRVLLDDLRQQFLLWRALPADTMEMYRHRTLTLLGDGAEADHG